MRASLAMTAFCAALAICQHAVAGDFVFGASSEILDPPGGEDQGISVELRTDPVMDIFGFPIRLTSALDYEDGGDTWFGIGAHATYEFADRWRLEGSFMPGVYSEGSDASDLGGPVQFRTQIGVVYAVRPELGVGAAVQHRSNARLYDNNPGSDAILVTLTYRK